MDLRHEHQIPQSLAVSKPLSLWASEPLLVLRMRVGSPCVRWLQHTIRKDCLKFSEEPESRKLLYFLKILIAIDAMYTLYVVLNERAVHLTNANVHLATAGPRA